LKNKNEYIKFLTIFLIVIIIILLIEYILLKLLGFNEQNFFLSSIITLSISFLFGILLAKFSLSFLVERNILLDKLLKDTLHELNIPVATILANVSMIKRKESDEKKLKRLERIQKAANQLLELYKDLDYHIKREIQKVNYDVFNLKELVEDRINFFGDIKGDIKIEKDLKDIYIKTDKSGFLKVIDNLLSNAIKYNKPKGLIRVKLNDKELIIEDTGIGMDESEIVKIFERYYQSTNSNSGFGIGLNIVKSFCDDNKIAISIDSKKGVGTRFILNLQKILT